MKNNEDALALMRQGAAMPGCNFNYQRTLLDAVSPPPQHLPLPRFHLLAVDARVKATDGNLTRAFEDISALFGISRHISGELSSGWIVESTAWRTLEDVLRRACR